MSGIGNTLMSLFVNEMGHRTFLHGRLFLNHHLLKWIVFYITTFVTIQNILI